LKLEGGQPPNHFHIFIFKMFHGDAAMEKGLDEAASNEEETPDKGENDEMESLRSELENLEEQLAEERAFSQNYLNSAKRVQADFDNYKKRQQREMDRVVECANDDLIKELLTILDDFERALSAEDSTEFRQGVKQIHSNLASFLKDHGLREVPTNGRFDPALHEALGVGDGKEGEILEVYQKGYSLGDRVIRYSKVKVGKDNQEGD